MRRHSRSALTAVLAIGSVLAIAACGSSSSSTSTTTTSSATSTSKTGGTITLLMGAALAQLALTGRPVTIHERPGLERSLFDIGANDALASVLFKYSTRRKSPWSELVPGAAPAIAGNA